MRRLLMMFLFLAVAATVDAQASSRPTVARRAAAKPDGDLAQLMRGILFPNSNLLFAVQESDPGAPPKKSDAAAGSTAQTYADVYAGWPSVEAAAVALAESADLILKPGRVCSNGKLVPVARPDFVKYAEALRVAGRKTLAAARARNREQVSDLTNDVADSCSNCHETYRDRGPAGDPARCTP